MRRFAYRTKQQARREPWIRVGLLFALLLGSMLWMDLQLRPVVQVYSAYQAKVYATRLINDAIYGELATADIRYDNLTIITHDANGTVTSIQTDMVGLNRLRGRATDAVLRNLRQMDQQTISIPMGTLSGFQIFTGRGPTVQMKVQPAGTLQTRIENRFDSAGINQTRHQIMLVMDMTVSAVIPGYTVSTEVETNFCLAETVIVGTVPDSYTQVEDSSRDVIPKIFDFKAE